MKADATRIGRDGKTVFRPSSRDSLSFLLDWADFSGIDVSWPISYLDLRV